MLTISNAIGTITGAISASLEYKNSKKDYSEEILQQAIWYKHYLNNFTRIVLMDQIVTRQFYDETGQIIYHLISLPKQFVK